MRDSNKSVVVLLHPQNIRPQFLVVEERHEKIDHGCHRSYVCVQGGNLGGQPWTSRYWRVLLC